MEIANKDGKPLDGGRTYRLNVLANPPVRLYWSATVYDRATHSFIREMPKLACSSLTPGLTKNADGSTDIHFGPKAMAGKEANWVPTKSGGGFEVLFRFYGAEKPLALRGMAALLTCQHLRCRRLDACFDAAGPERSGAFGEIRIAMVTYSLQLGPRDKSRDRAERCRWSHSVRCLSINLLLPSYGGELHPRTSDRNAALEPKMC
jgi:hypothetical protein